MNDSQAMVAQSAKLAQQARDIERQLAIARHALRQFAMCDLDERNCADLNVASKRIRNIANKALRDMGDVRERGMLPLMHKGEIIPTRDIA